MLLSEPVVHGFLICLGLAGIVAAFLGVAACAARMDGDE